MPPPPLPVADAVLITAERAKLPDDVWPLTDPAVPLPGDVRFFEKRQTTAGVLTAAAWSLGLAGFGLLCLLFGVAWLIESLKDVTVYRGAQFGPLGFGLVCLFAAWVMSDTALARIWLRRDQRAGRPTRVGILLAPTALIECGETSWAVLPRGRITAVAGGRIGYRLNDQDKSIRLPSDLLRGDARTLEAAVVRWRQGG